MEITEVNEPFRIFSGRFALSGDGDVKECRPESCGVRFIMLSNDCLSWSLL